MSGSIQARRVLDKLGEGTRPGHLMFNDFYNRPESISAKLVALVGARTLTIGSKGKMKVNVEPIATISPWYQTKTCTNRVCALYHEIFFRHFAFIPKFCRNCWKIVFTTHHEPDKQKVSDLFRMRDFIEQLAVPGKVGCDTRIYTPSRYSGFIYSDSFDDGEKYYQLFEPRFRELFPDGKVILKRACTEYEHRFGDSKEWDKLEAKWNALEDYLMFFIEPHDEPYFSGLIEHTSADTFRFWIDYAHGIGDESWKEALESQGYVVPDTLFPTLTTYHGEPQDEGMSGKG